MNRMIEYVNNIDKSTYNEDVAYFNEHSLIRSQLFYLEMEVPTFVATHFVRHSQTGQLWYVKSNREDLKGDGEATRHTPVRMCAVLNAKHLIDISRYRLCRKSHDETRRIWEEVLEKIKEIAPELSLCMMPNCFYRGGICPELNSCGYNKGYQNSV